MRFRDWLLFAAIGAVVLAYYHPAFVQDLLRQFQSPATEPSGTAPPFLAPIRRSTGANQTAAATPTDVVRLVSIYDSPAMPNVGGHSILGGLLTGKGLTAILPNLKVCARPKGASPGGEICTEVCKPGHQCLNQPFARRGVVLDPADPTITVDVFDMDRPGSQQNVATFDAKPADCNADKHCKFAVSDEAKFGNGATVEIGFGPDATVAAGGPSTAPPPPAPAPPVPTGRMCGDRTNATFFDHSAQKSPLYSDSNVDVWGGVTAYQGGNLVGASAPQPENNGITFTAKSCSSAPHIVQFVSRQIILSNGQRLPGRYMTSDPINPQNFATSYPYTTDINNPAWHVDARTPLNQLGMPDPPYYEAGQGAGWCVLNNQLTTFDQPSAGGVADATIQQALQAFNSQNGTNLTIRQMQPFFKTFVLCGDAPIQEFAWHVSTDENGRQAYMLDSVANRDPQTLKNDLDGLYLQSSLTQNRGTRVPIN